MKKKLLFAGLTLALTLGIASTEDAWAKKCCPEKPVACPVACPVERPVACPVQRPVACPVQQPACPECSKRRCPDLPKVKPCPPDPCRGCPDSSNLNLNCLPITGQPTVTSFQYGNGNQVMFSVVNGTGAPARFQVASAGINAVVPAGTERTFYVDLTDIHADNVAYTLNGSGGQILASGSIPNSTFSETSTMMAVDLSHIINYSTAYSYPIDPEPAYYERPASYPTRQPVRGYW